MSHQENISAQIAALNDQFRKNPFVPELGRFFCTFRIFDISDEARIEAISRMRNFTKFTENNDPYGLHDFGVIKIKGTPKMFWKIDVFADDTLTFGSNAPHDPQKSYRVITLMLASEY